MEVYYGMYREDWGLWNMKATFDVPTRVSYIKHASRQRKKSQDLFLNCQCKKNKQRNKPHNSKLQKRLRTKAKTAASLNLETRFHIISTLSLSCNHTHVTANKSQYFQYVGNTRDYCLNQFYKNMLHIFTD